MTVGQMLEEGFTDGSYPNQWYTIGDDHGSYCGLGINGQLIYVAPGADTVIVKLSTHPQADDDALFSDSMLACQAIAKALAKH
jgi:hypothetical protein